MRVCYWNCFMFLTKFDDLDHTNTIRYRSFNSSMLSSDISQFVSEALSDSRRHIRILCNFDNGVNGKTYKSFAEFSKYYRK